MKRVLLVGATDGIGAALAEALCAREVDVAVLGRDPEKLDTVVADLRSAHPDRTVARAVLDVTSGREASESALDQAVRGLGPADTIVYCAGHRSVDPDEASLTFAVNVLGAVDVLEWAARYFVRQHGGRIAALGAVAGERGCPRHGPYGASKAALHQYLEGLRCRMHPLGVEVTTIKPGRVSTRLEDRAFGALPAVSAERAGDLIARGLSRGKERFYVPWWWGAVSWGMRVAPSAIYKRWAPR